MTARDDLTALVGTPTRGLCPRSCRDTRHGPHVHNTLDAIARLATDPETAPVVFRWLVEAGVLRHVGWARRNTKLYDTIVPWFLYPIDNGEPIPNAAPIYVAGDA